LSWSSALLPNSIERPGPKSVSPAMYCSGVAVVVWLKWIVDMGSASLFRRPVAPVATLAGRGSSP
jgi:hypothetical protein